MCLRAVLPCGRGLRRSRRLRRNVQDRGVPGGPYVLGRNVRVCADLPCGRSVRQLERLRWHVFRCLYGGSSVRSEHAHVRADELSKRLSVRAVLRVGRVRAALRGFDYAVRLQPVLHVRGGLLQHVLGARLHGQPGLMVTPREEAAL